MLLKILRIRKELYSTSIEVKNARFSDDSIKEANVDIASYIVYNDESDFINQLSFAQIKTGDGLEEGTDSENPDGSDSSDTTIDQNPGNSGSDGGAGGSDSNTPSNGNDGSGTTKREDAFIEDSKKEYKRGYTTSNKLHVEIPTRGEMKANSGETPQKRVSVTVPTNASFTVKSDASFIGTTLKVTNNGELPVDISVADFIDPNGDYGIQLVTDQDVNSNISRTSYKRNQINLWLENEGESKKIYLGNRKLYTEIGSTESIIADEDKKIATVLNETTSTINICGKAGTNALDRDKPIRDNFKLILKVKRSSIN